MSSRTPWASLGALAVVLVPALAGAQSLSDLRKQYDAGHYQQVLDAAAAAEQDQPKIVYLSAQSAQRLSRKDDARKAYEQLRSRPESDPWHHVGRSGLALLSSDSQAAVEAANNAVADGESLPEAQFQAGLALSARQDWAGAAARFEKASQLDPGWAYAHYHAGLAYSKARRVDLMASHFQSFLKLAPQAPERPEVQSIMKTLGNR